MGTNMAEDRYVYNTCKTCPWDPTGYCPVSTHYGCVEKNGFCADSLEDVVKDDKYPKEVRDKAKSTMISAVYMSKGVITLG